MKALLPGLFLFILMAGCATSSPQATQETIPLETITATPDPLYALHCIRQSGRNNLCYAGEKLIGDRELLEKAAKDYCYHRDEFMCSIMIWEDEASVAQAVPLTEAERRSRIARFAITSVGEECFEVFENGEAVYSSKACTP